MRSSGGFFRPILSAMRDENVPIEQVLQETSPSLSLWAESRVMTILLHRHLGMNGCGAAAVSVSLS